MRRIHRLIIKGSVAQANTAANKRGIVLFDAYTPSRPNETVAHADIDRATAAKWFCEDAICGPETGYPSGTLLHYS